MTFLKSIAAAAACLALVACNQPQGASGSAANGSAGAIQGAGSTFAAPIYQGWAQDYKAGGGGDLNYQSIGSGGGIKQIKAATVDFGATDKPVKKDELDKEGLVQFPTILGGVVPVINVQGIAPNQLKLSGDVLARIYLGEIKTWNDAKIAALNPGLKLPALPITVVHRSDGSGTSFLFTSYLAAKSPAWASKVGASDSVEWPAGLGGKGNDGVSAFVRQTANSIGYVEYAYAKTNNMTTAQLQVSNGAFVAPTPEAFAAAAAGADWSKAPGFYLLLLDQPAAGAWPITGATFALIHKDGQKGKNAKGVTAFFDYAFNNGDAKALQLAYVPLPAAVKDLVRKEWAANGMTPAAK